MVLLVLLPLFLVGQVEAGTAPVINQGTAETPKTQVHKGVYDEREYAFQNGEVTLTGSLYLPAGPGPFPAVIMIHGSEPDTREFIWRTGDGPVFLDAGVAVFAYDKRGTGASAGDWRRASLEDLADDAIAAVELVKQQPEINPEQVGIFGVSQGGRLTALAAARSDEIDFLINITGAAVPFAQQEMWSAGNELGRRGFSDRAIATTVKVMHLLFSARPLIRSGVLPMGNLYIWFDALDPYQDPAESWRKVEQPAYIAYGGWDATVPSRKSAVVISDILAEQGHPLSRMVIYPQAGHGIRLESGEWAPGHIEAMTHWLQATLAGQATDEMAHDPATIGAGANRWYGLGSADTPWYASAGLQLPLFFFFLLAFAVGLGTGLSPWSSLNLSGYSGWPRAILIVASLLYLLLMAGIVHLIGYLAFADANNAGPDIPYSTLLSAMSLLGLVLAGALIFFTSEAYRQVGLSRLARGIYSLVSLAAVGFMLFLLYWGVLGLPL
jgi:pimeloyl-ACP methyl ester carboxylesterase